MSQNAINVKIFIQLLKTLLLYLVLEFKKKLWKKVNKKDSWYSMGTNIISLLGIDYYFMAKLDTNSNHDKSNPNFLD